MDIHPDELKHMPLFNGIQPDDIKPMLTCLTAYEKTYDKGEFISFRDGNTKYAGLILSGAIQMIQEDVWGHKTILDFLTKGSLLGETFACSIITPALATFYTAHKSCVMFMPMTRILRSCSSSCAFHHRLIENMVTIMADKNARLMAKTAVISQKTLREKILTYLSLQAKLQNSKYIQLPFGRLEFADYICADRSALTRELSNMKLAGLIDYEKNTFRLLN